MSAFHLKNGFKAWLSRLIPLAWLIGSFALLWPVLSGLESAQITAYWAAIGLWQWVLAGVATAVSLAAVSQYDLIGHRHFHTNVAPYRGRAAGAAAVALGQALGAGPVVGGLVRWRLLPDIGAAMAARITVFTTLTFVFGMAATIATIALLGATNAAASWLAITTLICVFCALLATVWWPHWQLGRVSMHMPSLRAHGAAILWAFVDIGYAGLALYALLPAEVAVAFWPFLTAFAVALAVGVLSGTPAGAGPFDLTLLSIASYTMPQVPDTAALLVAFGAFRIVYYVAPAILAFVYLTFAPKRGVASGRAEELNLTSLAELPRAESGVIRQTGGQVAYIAGHLMAVSRTAQTFIGLFDPSEAPRKAFFPELARRARQRNRFAVLYKCSAQTAVRARTAGWSVIHLADEAMVIPATFDVQCPACSGLRRKLRKADRAGVTVERAHVGDMAALAALDADWQARHGPARGATMGRFCPSYLSGQRVYVARVDGIAVAFASFHATELEWSLDLMRDGQGAPDGTIYKIVATALADARAQEIGHLCLAAAPACPNPSSALWRAFAIYTAGYSHAAGLRQFKSAFAPTWTPRYVAAPNLLALCIGLADIAREVMRPVPLPEAEASDFKEIHINDENNEVASKSAA